MLPERAPNAAEPANITKATVAVCELEVGGLDCGVQAVGRCAFYGRAFCAQHQCLYVDVHSLLPPGFGMFSPPGLPSPAECVNRCTLCFEILRAKVTELPAVKHWLEIHAAEEYFISGTARNALLANGVQPAEIYQVTRRWETKRKGVLRRCENEQVEDVIPGGRGWILGMFKWEYRDPPQGKNSSGDQVYATCMTALLDASHTSPPRFLSFDSWSFLARVSPYSRGYEALQRLAKILSHKMVNAEMK